MEIREATATSSAGFSKIMESFNGDHHQTDDNGPMSKQIWSKKLRKIVPFERAETPATFSQHHNHNYPVRPGSTSTNTESTSMSPPSDHDGTVIDVEMVDDKSNFLSKEKSNRIRNDSSSTSATDELLITTTRADREARCFSPSPRKQPQLPLPRRPFLLEDHFRGHHSPATSNASKLAQIEQWRRLTELQSGQDLEVERLVVDPTTRSFAAPDQTLPPHFPSTAPLFPLPLTVSPHHHHTQPLPLPLPRRHHPAPHLQGLPLVPPSALPLIPSHFPFPEHHQTNRAHCRFHPYSSSRDKARRSPKPTSPLQQQLRAEPEATSAFQPLTSQSLQRHDQMNALRQGLNPHHGFLTPRIHPGFLVRSTSSRVPPSATVTSSTSSSAEAGDSLRRSTVPDFREAVRQIRPDVFLHPTSTASRSRTSSTTTTPAVAAAATASPVSSETVSSSTSSSSRSGKSGKRTKNDLVPENCDLTPKEIVEDKIDDFNEKLQKYSPAVQAQAKEGRRKGKNRTAARRSRDRKNTRRELLIKSRSTLEAEVNQLEQTYEHTRRMKEELKREHQDLEKKYESRIAEQRMRKKLTSPNYPTK